MRTWRKVVKACLKYAILNVVLVCLMLATTFLQVLPPAMADTTGADVGQIANISTNNNSQSDDIPEYADDGVNNSIKSSNAPQITPNADAKNDSLDSSHPRITDLSKIFNERMRVVNETGNVANENGQVEQGVKKAVVEPQKVTSKVTPDKDADIKLNTSSKTINLHMPKGAVDKEVNVEIIDHESQDGGMLSIYEFHASPTVNDKAIKSLGNLSSEALSEVKHFNKKLTISIQHNPDELWGLNLDTLKLYCLDEDTRQWVAVPDSKFDPATNTLTAIINHFSYYGENADPTFAGPGKVMNFQNDLHTGAATYSYPIEVPPGVAGFQPNINLIYNSASVDEMKNKKDVGSWVGTGWSLGMGSIQQVGLTDFIMSLDGASYYKLKISPSDTGCTFSTIPETYYQITFNGLDSDGGWEITGTDGIKYRFGGTNSSTQYIGTETGKVYYRWDTSSIEDTNGNTINVDYVQDKYPSGYEDHTVRSAYPNLITYNNGSVRIVFDSSPDRADNPQRHTQVTEDRRLNAIKIYVVRTTDIFNEEYWDLVREYNFTYNVTPCYESNDYSLIRYGLFYYDESSNSSEHDLIQYAGEFSLTSITEKGSDGTSALPSMNLSYADLSITCKDSSDIAYHGNPGNLATLTHPYLTGVTNGYGASINYTYSQKPQSWHDINADILSNEALPGLIAAWYSTSGDVFASTIDGQILNYNGYSWSNMSIANEPQIYGIWGTASSDVFAVGYDFVNGGPHDTILHYDGAIWDKVYTNNSDDLWGIWGTSSSDIFAVGTPGVILYYNGSNWSPMDSGVYGSLRDVWGTSHSNVYAVGYGGTILNYDGINWNTLSTNSSAELFGVWGASPEDIYAVGGMGTVLHWNGSAWSTLDIGASSNTLFRIWGSSATDIFVSSLSEDIFHYNGTSWSVMDSGTTDSWVLGICGNSSSNVYAVGIQSGQGFALKYNGSSWDEVNNKALPLLTGSWCSPYDDIYVSSSEGNLLRYDGYYWTDITTDNSQVLWDIWGSSPSDVYAVGCGGTVLQYNGSVCTTMDSSTTQDLWGVWGNSSSSVFAVGLYGTILYYNGSAWITMNSSIEQDLYGVWGNSATNVFAVGSSGTILHYDGFTWSSMTSSTSEELMGVWGNSSSNIFAVGSSGTILRYNGQTWSPMNSGTADTFRGVWGNSATDMFAVGIANAIYHYDGISWSRMDSGIEDESAWLLDICGNSLGEAYVVGVSYNGIVLKFPYSEDIWTREIVTAKTIDSGTGSQQTYNYVYTGDPQYFKVGPGTHPWDDQYRGFPQVRVIDPEGNYVDHYFWTTGIGDAEILTGKEYRTDWYDASNQLMERKDYTWSYRFNGSQPYDLYPGTVGYWAFNESAGQTVYDSSGNGNDGTLGPTTENESSDPQWANGRFESALSFDGNDDYVRLNSSVSLNLTKSFMLEAWIKRDSLNTRDCILAAGTGVDSDSAHHQLLWYIEDSGNNSRMVFKMGNGEGEYVNASSESYYRDVDLNVSYLSDSLWHHVSVLFIYDAIYWDYAVGFFVDSITANVSVGSFNGQPLTEGIEDWRIGSLAGGGDYFHGSIDDVRLYNVFMNGSIDTSYSLSGVPFIYIKETTDTIGSKTSRTRYDYDAYGNVQNEYLDGDINISDDDVTILRGYSPNLSANILNKPTSEFVYNEAGIYKGGWYFYDGSTDINTPPAKGQITTVWDFYNGGEDYVSTSYSYDSYGNVISETDANDNTWNTTYESTYNTFPATITSPLNQSESYTFDPKTGNLLSHTDANGQTISYEYDVFGRETKVIKPGDSIYSPSIRYEYNTWGNLSQPNLSTFTKVNVSDYLWSTQYFDGIGRGIQTQSGGDTGHTIIDSTTSYNSRGLADKVYVPQDMNSSNVSGYVTPNQSWINSTTTYDGLGRAISATAADGTTTGVNYSIPWQQTVTDALGHKHTYYYDAFGQLTRVDELDAADALYASTNYSYDGIGNLIQVVDANGNIASMSYDWLGRKTAMSDPDMGNWSYQYDNNSNLVSQTDAKSQTVTLTYDVLNRLTGKLYPAGSGMTNVSYIYDNTSGGNYSVGRCTGMSDASGTTSYMYDQRGRLTQESRNISGADYATGFLYDAGDRLTTVTYPTGENVTQTYNSRGLPNTLNGSVAGNLVTNTSYNQLGQTTRINLSNGDFDTYAYYGLDDGAPAGNWSRLWQIKTANASATLRDVRYTWDDNGNMRQRQDALASETENFSYDFLDRLTSVSGAYSENYTYSKIGNILSKNDVITYTYGSKPHAVTAVGNISYAYDANGNMITRGSQNLTYDMANMPTSVITSTIIPPTAWGNMTSGTNYQLFSVWGSNASNVLAVGGGGTIRQYNGSVWSTMTSGTTKYLCDIWGSNASNIFVVGENGTARHYDGIAWGNMTSNTSNYLWSVWGSNASNIFAVGNGGTILYNNGSTSWTNMSNASVTTQALKGVWGSSASDIFAVGVNGTIIHNNGNASWTTMYSGTTKQFLSVWGSNASDVFAVGVSGKILHYNGASWSAMTSYTNKSLWSVWGTGPNDVFAVGTDGTVMHYNGSKWSAMNNSNPTILYGVWGSSGDNVFAVGNSGTIISYQNSVQQTVSSFVYDGDGNRVKKIEGGETTVYVNQYYEKNLTTNETTTHYYSGGKEVAYRTNNSLRYVHQDSLSSTSVTTNSAGAVVASVKFFPYGSTRSQSGNLDTDKLFTGQRLDDTGLYYYNARYYDATIGRFISPDTIVQDPTNPQTLNRYSYCLNNPLKYTDPSGHVLDILWDIGSIFYDLYTIICDPSNGWNWGALAADTACAFIPLVSGGGAALRAIDKGVDAVRGLERVDDFTDTVKAFDKGAEALSGLNKAEHTISLGTKATETAKAATIGRGSRAALTAEHHIVAQGSVKATEARAVLEKFGVGVQSQANKVILPTSRLSSAEGMLHPSLHTDTYYQAVGAMLRPATSQEDVLKTLNAIRVDLLKGTFPR